ncbi:hypothetical protein LXL04_011888 [Taraxacum kok-saghyz]
MRMFMFATCENSCSQHADADESFPNLKAFRTVVEGFSEALRSSELTQHADADESFPNLKAFRTAVEGFSEALRSSELNISGGEILLHNAPRLYWIAMMKAEIEKGFYSFLSRFILFKYALQCRFRPSICFPPLEFSMKQIRNSIERYPPHVCKNTSLKLTLLYQQNRLEKRMTKYGDVEIGMNEHVRIIGTMVCYGFIEYTKRLNEFLRRSGKENGDDCSSGTTTVQPTPSHNPSFAAIFFFTCSLLLCFFGRSSSWVRCATDSEIENCARLKSIAIVFTFNPLKLGSFSH